MIKISDLKSSSNVEYIANELFNLIKQKDKNISIDLDNFDDNITSKYLNISKELVDNNFDNSLLIDKKTQLESYHKDAVRFTQIFNLLDNKLNNEIKNTNSLSEKEDLQQNFLFKIRQKNTDFYSIKKQSEILLSSIEKKLSVLDTIKSLRNDSTDKNKPKIM